MIMLNSKFDFFHAVELVESYRNQEEVEFWKEASVIDILCKPSQQNARDEETSSTDSDSNSEAKASQSDCMPFIQHY